MKKLYYLVNFEMRMLIRIIVMLLAGMCIIQSASFLIVSNMEKNRYLRFEELLDISGIPVVFYIALIIALLSSAYSFYRDFLGGKSIYALLTLPQKRDYVFISKAIASTLCVYMLWAAQLVSLFICYLLYSDNISTYDIPGVHNALLLAFARSGFLRLVFPLDPLSFLTVAMIAATLVIFVLFTSITERSGKYALILIPLPWVLSGMIYQVFPLYETRISIFIILISMRISKLTK